MPQGGPSVFSTIHSSFNAGELSPLLFGRVDIDKYKSGLALARNVYVDYRGGLSNRSGTQYIDTINGTSGAPHTIPFVVNTQTSYVLVFTGNGLIKFYSNGAYVGGADLSSPYAIADVPTVKFNQSANVLTLTHPAYPIYQVTRTGPSTFSIAQFVPGSTMKPPTSPSGHAQVTSNNNSVYTYMVTSVSQDGKEESVPCSPFFFTGFGGSTGPVETSISWSPPASGPVAASYKIYKAGPFAARGVAGAVASIVPTVYGYIGQSTSTSFFDNLFTPDYSITPPSFSDPFTPGQVASVQPATPGSGYGSVYIAPLVFTGGTPTRAAAGYGIVDTSTNTIVGVVLTDPGAGYVSTPTVTDSVGSATYSVTMGQTSGTYPSSSTYFQQRQVFGGTPNFPESFVASVPGKYTNFDVSPITNAADSITASIASTQNNTIVSMVPMSTGLIVFTYGSAFLVTGGSQSSAVTPSSIVALPQASFGASNLPPIPINYTVLYTEALGFTVRDLTFNFYYQNYVGVDRSILSSHLFFGYSFVDWAFCEAPFRLMHMTRNDGQMLTFTYVPEQEMFAWTHYDTNGQFVSICSVPEGQYNVLYAIVRRFIQGTSSWVYFLERFVPRNFQNIIDPGVWFVDAGLSYPQGAPSATLQPSVPVAGVTTLTYSGALGVTAHVGDIVQAYGVQIELTAVAAGVLTGTVLFGSLPTIPNDPFSTPIQLTPGNVTITTPVQTISGLTYLEGMMVTGVADGVVVPPTKVVGGQIVLPEPATSIILGLAYTAQVQTLRLTAQGTVTEGKRKNIPALTLRLYQSAGVEVGRSFDKMTTLKTISAPINPQVQLVSDDVRSVIGATWDKDGQVCFQQALPLPMTVLADIPEVVPGDTYRG